MSDTCHCHDNYVKDVLIPQVGVITDIREETPDVKTFRVNAPEGGKLFEHMPGQCAMLCAPGVSEGMFSITSSPTNKEYQEFSIKKCGQLTDYLHSLEVGDEIPCAARTATTSGRRQIKGARTCSLSPAASVLHRCALSSTTCSTTAVITAP